MTTPRRGTFCLASKERTRRPRSGMLLFAFIVGGLGVFFQELARVLFYLRPPGATRTKTPIVSKSGSMMTSGSNMVGERRCLSVEPEEFTSWCAPSWFAAENVA